MRTVAIVALLAASATRSEPIYLEYEGTVTDIHESCSCAPIGYSLGEEVSGTITINMGLAPPDGFPELSRLGIYGDVTTGADFVTGGLQPSSHWPSDMIEVRYSPTTQSYDVQDAVFYRKPPANGDVSNFGRDVFRIHVIDSDGGLLSALRR